MEKEVKVIDQKKYLQKYLKSEKKKKKKKVKTIQSGETRVKVIDDDIDFGQLMPVDESGIDIYTVGEDAPQIAGVIDERPLDVQLSEKFIFDSSRWKVVTEDDGFNSKLVIEKQRRRNHDEPEILETEKVAHDIDDSDNEVPRRRKDSDNEVPRRKQREDSDNEVPRRRKQKEDSDNEVPRRRNQKEDSDNEVPRRKQLENIEANEDYDIEVPRIKQEPDSDNDDLPRRRQPNITHQIVSAPPRKKSRWKNANDSDTSQPEIKKERPTVVSFNIRNPDKADKKEKEAIRKVQLEKYDRWGKGLKQVEDRQQRLEEDIHEMQKPLARYADDADLENYLKDQERDGDPMLEYLRKQRAEEQSGEEKGEKPRSSKPRYNGAFMPNRFGIPPGHRWDGVDRSNGYEKDWIQSKNSRKVVEEDAYKWSTDDM